jgi:hypothetical protein
MEHDPTWVWIVLEVVTVIMVVVLGTLWQRAQAGTTAPELVARYRRTTLGSALFVVLVAIRLATHAY